MISRKRVPSLVVLALAGSVLTGGCVDRNSFVESRDKESFVQEYKTNQNTLVRFHETGKLEDGTPYGRLGSFLYLLTPEGDPVSYGFHGIFPDGNGGYIATLGACKYELGPHFGILKASSDDCTDDLSEYPFNEVREMSK